MTKLLHNILPVSTLLLSTSVVEHLFLIFALGLLFFCFFKVQKLLFVRDVVIEKVKQYNFIFQFHGFTCGVDDLLLYQKYDEQRTKIINRSEQCSAAVHAKLTRRKKDSESTQTGKDPEGTRRKKDSESTQTGKDPEGTRRKKDSESAQTGKDLEGTQTKKDSESTQTGKDLKGLWNTVPIMAFSSNTLVVLLFDFYFCTV
jgi:hypothetical protein